MPGGAVALNEDERATLDAMSRDTRLLGGLAVHPAHRRRSAARGGGTAHDHRPDDRADCARAVVR